MPRRSSNQEKASRRAAEIAAQITFRRGLVLATTIASRGMNMNERRGS
jgi:hypothetical protein